MSYTLLISTDELAHHLNDPDWAVIDCRFDLNDPAKGRAAYLDAHIPGAIYAHLDEDLSSPIVPGATGRHPLPTPDVFAARLSRWGIDEKTQVVVYDDAGGLYAGRLWWMLRWLGHDAVALLDGGWQQWLKEVRPTLGGEDTRSPRTFVPHVQEEMLADVDEVLANLENDEFVLVDVRDSDWGLADNTLTNLLAEQLPIDTLLLLLGQIELPLPSVAGISITDAVAFRDASGVHTSIGANL